MKHQRKNQGMDPPSDKLSGIDRKVVGPQRRVLRSGKLAPRCEDYFVHIFDSEEEDLLMLNENEVKKRNTRESSDGHFVHDLNVNNCT